MMSNATTMRMEYEDGELWARRIIVTDERGKGDWSRTYERRDLILSAPALELTDEQVVRFTTLCLKPLGPIESIHSALSDFKKNEVDYTSMVDGKSRWVLRSPSRNLSCDVYVDGDAGSWVAVGLDGERKVFGPNQISTAMMWFLQEMGVILASDERRDEPSLRERLLEAVDKMITIDEDRHGRRRTTVKLIDVGESYLVTWSNGAAKVVSIEAIHRIWWISDEPREVVVAGSLAR